MTAVLIVVRSPVATLPEGRSISAAVRLRGMALKCYRARIIPLPIFMADFLTVKEAALLVGKSPSSIRRLIYPILADDKHADRPEIQPSVEDALKLRLKGDNFAWRISEEFLKRAIPVEAAAPKDHPPTSKSGVDATGDLLAMLKGELDIKNQQIAQQAETISKLTELTAGLSARVGEGNHLIAGLQRQLSLSDGRERNSPATVDVPSRPTAKEEGSKPTAKKPASKKGGFFGLFR